MELIWQPREPWSWIAAGAWLVHVVAVAFYFRRGFAGMSRAGRRFALGASLTMGGAFCLATLDPEVRSPGAPTAGAHLVVVLDVSRSVQRGAGKLADFTDQQADRLARTLERLPGAMRKALSGQIVLVGANARVESEAVPAETMVSHVRQLRPDRLPRADATDLAAGLDLALRQLNGRRGNVLLISDGHATTGDVVSAAKRVTGQGHALHVWPVDAATEALRIRSASLPTDAVSGSPITLRAQLETDSATPVSFSIATRIHSPRATGSHGDHQRQVSRARPYALAEEVVLSGDGMQAVDLVVTSGNHRLVRRFFVHVQRQPRVLVVGGDFDWVEAIRSDDLEIVTASPAAVASTGEFEPGAFDVVVLSAVPAGAFTSDGLNAIVGAVRDQARGLLLLNGSHAGRKPEETTVIGSYARTPLEEILPVTAEPRAFEVPPPSRQIVLMVDTSGSMNAHGRLQIEQDIARSIINKLRPEDELQIIAFTTTPSVILMPTRIDDAGRTRALSGIDRLVASGGTDPGPALDLIKGRKLNNGGLIFISDGGFQESDLRHPDLTTIVFAIEPDSEREMQSLQRWTNFAIRVGPGFNPASVKIPYFEPQKRTRFFEPGEFTPIVSYRGLSVAEQWPVPPLPMAGTAATVAKPGATSIAWRDRPKERVLALGEAGLGRVAVFTSQIPGTWLRQEAGRKDIADWLKRLRPITDRNRYRVRVRDRGDALGLTIALNSPADQPLPRVTELAAEFQAGPRSLVTLPLSPVENAPAEFLGMASVPRTATRQDVMLAVRETGGVDAQPARQFLHFVIPPQETIATPLTSEDWSDGRNVALLTALAERGSGSYDSDAVWPALESAPPRIVWRLWPWLVIAGVSCQLLVATLRQLAS